MQSTGYAIRVNSIANGQQAGPHLKLIMLDKG